MKVFGRDLESNRSEVRELYRYPWYFLKCFLIFRRPFHVIRCYLNQESPEGDVIGLRNGLIIRLSGHPHDVVTVFVVFVRRDYGGISPGGVVLDIGANIGVFSLYSVSQGARAVYAFEPNSASFEILVENIRANNLQGVIVPHRLAVAGENAGTVKFPKGSSCYNAIVRDETEGDWEHVRTASLEWIVTELLKDVREIELLKMDCEGAEYEILETSRADVLRPVRKVRLEYHAGRVGDLMGLLGGWGYVERLRKEENVRSGILWADRRIPA